MVQLRAELLVEVERTRDSLVVLEGLTNHYASLTEAERQEANEVLGEWLLSGDPTLWYDALWVAGHCRIASLIPTMQVLEQRLIASPAAHDRHYAPVVRNVIGMIRSNDEKA